MLYNKESSLTKRKQQFRFNDNKDEVLLKEIQSILPFKATHGLVLEKWDQVALNFEKTLGEDGVGITGTLAQSRFKILMNQFKNKEKRSLQASGVEEGFNEVTQLLTDLNEQV